jgi:signal transduction histidine kinase
MIGFAVALAALILYSLFTLRQVTVLRKLQADTVERNRLDSIQLVRIQSTLYEIGMSLHDVLEEPYGISGFEQQFRRQRDQLADAIRRESRLTPNPRNIPQQQQLHALLGSLNSASEQVFIQARAGNDKRAKELIIGSLRPQRDALSHQISQMLILNNELDEQTAAEIQQIYTGVERDLYGFLLAAVLAIAVTAIALVSSNRRFFQQLASLSDQKSVLARKLISLQEEMLRSVSRELHDEFGQIFTAIGAMLSRLERKGVPVDSPLRSDLEEVREITQTALDRVRSLSQMLHPAVIDDYGLEKAVEWYVPMFEKQTGIPVDYEKIGTGPVIKDQTAIHVYRILQEALNNVARHSGAKRATVRVHYAPDQLRLEVEDRGKGIPAGAGKGRRGLGLIAMRERAELVHGKLKLETPPVGGTLVSLEVPTPEINDAVPEHEHQSHE